MSDQKEAFGQRMDGGYETPILVEPAGGPVPVSEKVVTPKTSAAPRESGRADA
jgi:hypothetical protein